MKKHHSRAGTAGSREREQPGKGGRALSLGENCGKELVDGQREGTMFVLKI